ncbi:proline racemase family protein [Candidatus Zixiibacteriota bacterium]
MTGSMNDWSPPGEWVRITTIDAHTAGEPLRIITGGMPVLEGESILELRRYLKENFDNIRTTLMWEPRGHREMYGCVITPPFERGSDFGILFMHNEGYSTMCGHGIIGIGTVAPEIGLVPLEEPETVMVIDTPAGQVTTYAQVIEGRVRSVHFHNVPSFVTGLDERVKVPGIGWVTYDLAFGGAYYAFVQAEDFGFSCVPAEQNDLITVGMAIKEAVTGKGGIEHPVEKDLTFLYGTIFIAPSLSEEADSRNVCVFADGQVDRSPTGTGVSGRMAIHYARGEVGIGDPLTIESIVGTTFTGTVVEPVSFEGQQAVIPDVRGSASITGRHEFLIDPDDPLREGFFLG